MAKLGLQYPVYKSEKKSGVIAKAIQADISITVNNVPLYADDALAENDRSFQNGTLTLGIDDLKDEIQAEFLGHEIDEETGEITANKNDVSPYVGVGFFGTKKVNNIPKYRAVWLPKIQFGEPNDTNQTKGETVTWNTPVLEGAIMTDDAGDWKKEQTFDTIAEAKAYLDGKREAVPEA